MKNWRLLIATLLFPLFHVALGQGVPSLMNYQGRLNDASGAALPPGHYSIVFRLWASAAGVNPADLVWSRQHEVTIVSNGNFNVTLGSPGGTVVPGEEPKVNDLAYAFAAPNRFLGLTVLAKSGVAISSPTELIPRQQLMSAPYAFSAQTAQTLGSGSLVVTNVNADFLLDLLNPPGTIVAFGGENVPPGWLLCDGRAVSSAQYPRLYGAISRNWGAGFEWTETGWVQGTNDFNLPDLRGVFLRGVNGERNGPYSDPQYATRTNHVQGGSSGNAVGSFQSDAFQAHQHSINAYWDDTRGSSVRTSGGGGDNFPAATRLAGENASETRPRNAYVHYIIKY